MLKIHVRHFMLFGGEWKHAESSSRCVFLYTAVWFLARKLMKLQTSSRDKSMDQSFITFWVLHVVSNIMKRNFSQCPNVGLETERVLFISTTNKFHSQKEKCQSVISLVIGVGTILDTSFVSLLRIFYLRRFRVKL